VTGSGSNSADAEDFGAAAFPSGTVNFAAGDTSQTITLQVSGDSVVESDEGFTVTMSSPSGATIATAAASGTIRNDDAASFSSGDVSITEGNAGIKSAVFTVTLNNAVAGGTSVSYATANGTATAGSDYLATAGTLNFTGTAGETKTVSVTINGDTTVETNENFFLNLFSPTNGVTLADSQGLGTIANDDVPSPVGVTLTNVTVSEATPFVVVAVNLSAATRGRSASPQPWRAALTARASPPSAAIAAPPSSGLMPPAAPGVPPLPASPLPPAAPACCCARPSPTIPFTRASKPSSSAPGRSAAPLPTPAAPAAP
jgi:hypothetical protein